MKKAEITELRKLYKKKEDCSIRQIAYGYINADKTIKSICNNTFLTLEDGEQFKYLELIRTGMSGSIGKNIYTADMEDNEMKKMLLTIKASKFQNEELLKSFFTRVANTYEECKNILVLLITNTYDVPMRGNDGFMNVDISEEVYDFMQCFVCPVNLEDPGLSYDESVGKFEEKMTRWCVEKPMCSFIYPSFEDRCTDEDKVTIFSNKEADTEFLSAVLNLNSLSTKEEQQTIFNNAISETITSYPDKLAAIKTIQERINEAQEETKENTAKEPVKKVILSALKEEKNRSDMTEETAAEAMGYFTNAAGINSLQTECLVKKELVIKSPDVIVKVKIDNANLVKTREIDGRKCLVIDITDETVDVNGIEI